MTPALTAPRELHRRQLRRLRVTALTAVLMLGAHLAQAGSFAVQPTRLELGPARPSGALTVRNEGAAPLSFQVKGMRWTQDEEGQEHHTETEDLIYFPKLLTLSPGQSAVIRLGLRQPPGALEKTYRLFIEELAPPVPAEAGPQARIRVLVRLGAPVFVAPLAPRQQLTLAAFDLARGQVRWTLHNEGSRHEVFQAVALRGLDAAGAEVFKQAFSERYFLAGAARRFRVDLPADTCPRIQRLVLEVKTDRSQVQQSLDAGAAACATLAGLPG